MALLLTWVCLRKQKVSHEFGIGCRTSTFSIILSFTYHRHPWWWPVLQRVNQWWPLDCWAAAHCQQWEAHMSHCHQDVWSRGGLSDCHGESELTDPKTQGCWFQEVSYLCMCVWTWEVHNNTLADGSKVNYHKNAYGGFMLTVHDTIKPTHSSIIQWQNCMLSMYGHLMLLWVPLKNTSLLKLNGALGPNVRV